MKLLNLVSAIAKVALAATSVMAFASDWGPSPPDSALLKPAAFLAEQKFAGSDGWPLRLPLEQWGSAEALVQKDAAWTRWVNDRRSALDDWMSKRQDHVEWVVGWGHDYVNSDGALRSWRVDEAPGDNPDTPGGRKLKEAWNYNFRAQHVDRVQEATRLFRLTHDVRYAIWAASQLDFYTENYDKWPLQKRLGISRLMGQSLDEATVILRLVDAARLLSNYVTKAQQQDWAKRLFRPVADTLEQSYGGVNNISCWQRSAMAVIALHLGDEAMFARATEGPKGLRQLLHSGVNTDSMWYEGSMGYNAYVVRALLPFFEAVARNGRGPAFAAEMLQVQNMMLMPMALRFPDSSLPNPSDNVGRLKAPDISILIESRRVLPTRLGVFFAVTRKSWEQLIDPAQPLDKVPPLPPVISRVLPASQMAVLKNENWQVFVHWGQSVIHHAQREALNLEVFAGDEPLSRDPGTTFYGSPLHANYFTQPAAHNVPFSDDRGQLGWAPGVLHTFDAATGTLNVLQPQYNANQSASRMVQLKDDVLVDELKLVPRTGTPTPSSVGAVWQFDCELSGFESFQPSQVHLPSGEGFQFWTDVQAFTLRDEGRITARCGARTVKLKIEVLGEFTLFKARAPEMPPKKRDALYLRKAASNAVIRFSFQTND